ncbi:MAG: bifunctional phosphopantothenoylcysteine decarboxylase/phosphopantothenate--cysteine ligase CoaBC [Lewinellaceae bacterium]|nr:bifunctional phosphopantothenoylcysteine decarboxylase/phosphopantothenate--cysteine ligase CoaBC [Saprospiraceae bacterium]MCB9314073.1 bifunctional phosphopantothenoylcysteine decarboxylase/phosphopantothenate--cysteine ligase CoaBC [Lewinellaceae bacterium]
MSALQGTRILLGITGSIAAYKAAFLTRLLVRAGAEVRVVMTPSAARFISPLTLSTLSQHPVMTEIMDEGQWNNHVEMGLWADRIVVAPATANTLAAMANGLCDNLLLAILLSARCDVLVAPAMDLDMWAHPATRRNMDTLLRDGVKLIPVGDGELASGLVGPGRMAEPEEILRFLIDDLRPARDLAGKTVIVTAGPTQEALDPVRYLTNHSSGKMGVAIADELARRGANVRLLLGPVEVRPQQPSVSVIPIVTARDLLRAAEQEFPSCDAAVLAAAVADYRPATEAREKIKKTGDNETLSLDLVRNPDIAATLGATKRKGQILVGFALETTNELAYARKKLEAKKFDMIVLNSLRDPGAGFAGDTNKISLVYPSGEPVTFDLKSKADVAKDIVNALAALL